MVHPCAALGTATGISHHLLRGAVAFAENGAVAIEGYPLDNNETRIDTTMAYVGTLALFEKAGFKKVAVTDSVLAGFPCGPCDSTFAEHQPARSHELAAHVDTAETARSRSGCPGCPSNPSWNFVLSFIHYPRTE